MIAVVPFNLARVLNFVYFWPQGPAQRASDCPPESASDRRFVEAFRRLLFVFFFVKKKMAFKFLSVKTVTVIPIYIRGNGQTWNSHWTEVWYLFGQRQTSFCDFGATLQVSRPLFIPTT